MPNLEFSLPYNNDNDTLDELCTLQGLGGNTISEIYLSCPQQYSGSGRITPKLDLDRFVQTIAQIHDHNIKVNMVMNTTCQGADWYTTKVSDPIINFIEKMHYQHGVEAVTIANPIYMQLVKQRLPKIEICASVLSDIDNVKKATIIREHGADVITPDANINRDLELLSDIKEATGARIKLMVNEGCLYHCPYRKFHFNFVSHWSKELEHSSIDGKDFFDHCMAVTLEDRSQILKSGWIRPEDIERYRDITNYFKVVGRTRGKSMVIRASKAYMNQSYDGNLIDIVCSSLHAFGMSYGAFLDNTAVGDADFFNKITRCDRRCIKCNYCQELADKLIKLNVVTRGKLEDMGRKELADKLEASGRLPYFG